MKITKKERAGLIKEIAKRMKNVVYMNTERHATKILDDLGIKDSFNLRPDDKLNFHYDIEMVGDDIFEIIGGLRRNKRKLKKIK